MQPYYSTSWHHAETKTKLHPMIYNEGYFQVSGIFRFNTQPGPVAKNVIQRLGPPAGNRNRTVDRANLRQCSTDRAIIYIYIYIYIFIYLFIYLFVYLFIYLATKAVGESLATSCDQAWMPNIRWIHSSHDTWDKVSWCALRLATQTQYVLHLRTFHQRRGHLRVHSSSWSLGLHCIPDVLRLQLPDFSSVLVDVPLIFDLKAPTAGLLKGGSWPRRWSRSNILWGGGSYDCDKVWLHFFLSWLELR